MSWTGGRGVGGALMEALERVIRGACEVGALGATDAAVPLYRGAAGTSGRADVGAHAGWGRADR